MKKNVLKCITTIMLALTLCTTTLTHDTLPLQTTTTLESIEPLSNPPATPPIPNNPFPWI